MKVGGQIPWNVAPICETSQIYCLIGRRPMKDVLGNHLKDRLFHLVHWLSITYNCEGPVKNPSIWKGSRLSWIVSQIRTVRGVEFGRVTYWLQALRSWKRRTHRKSTRERLDAKEVIFPKEEGSFIFPIADDDSTPWRSRPENIHRDTAATNSRRKSP